MSPWMNTDTRPDAAREGCGNCGEPWEEHQPCDCGVSRCFVRYCADGEEYRPESDEDRIADRAGSMGL